MIGNNRSLSATHSFTLYTGKRDSNVFELLETKQHVQKQNKTSETDTNTLLQDQSSRHGIGEIGVSYIELKPDKPAEHFTLLNRSVSTKHSGNLAKHGARKTYLFYRNVNENERPITALALIDTNNGDEA